MTTFTGVIAQKNYSQLFNSQITTSTRLLGQLAPAEISEHIPGWSSQGQVSPVSSYHSGLGHYFHCVVQVYYQFISIERSVESLLATRDEASVQVRLFKNCFFLLSIQFISLCCILTYLSQPIEI